MNKDEKLAEIRKAMKMLGYPDTERLELRDLDDIRTEVVYGKYLHIGIYDFAKHTFVD